MPWDKHGSGYTIKGKSPGKGGGFVKNPKQYEKLKEKYGKERAAAITNAVSKRERYITNAEMKTRQRAQQGMSRASGTLAVGSLGALGTAAALKNPRVAMSAARATSKVGQKTGKSFRLKPMAHSTKLKNAATGLGIGSIGLGGASSFNSATLMQGQRQREQGMSRKKNSIFAKSYEEITDLPHVGEEGHRIPDEEIEKGIGDWKTIDQRERSQSRSRKTMRGAATVGSLGAGLAAAGMARGGSLKGGIETGKEAHKLYGLARSAGDKPAKAAATSGKYFGQRHASFDRKGDIPVTAGVGLMGGAAVTGAGAKGHHTYQQHKINVRRRNNAKKKQLSKSLFDSERSRMGRSEKYTTGTDITTGGLAAGAAGMGNKARKEGFLKPIKTGGTKGGKALKLAGGKSARGAAGLGAAAAATAYGSHRMKQNRKSSWAPYG